MRHRLFPHLNALRRVLMDIPTTSSQSGMICRRSAHYRSGALKPKPEQMPFGLVGVLCAVVPGLFIGAAISKSVANFLEENELFVPSDDEDDD